MTRQQAEQLADTVAVSNIRAMFEAAYVADINWNGPSVIDPKSTKRTAFNTLSAQLYRESPHFMRRTERAKQHRVNMLVEFGEWLGEDLKEVA